MAHDRRTKHMMLAPRAACDAIRHVFTAWRLGRYRERTSPGLLDATMAQLDQRNEGLAWREGQAMIALWLVGHEPIPGENNHTRRSLIAWCPWTSFGFTIREMLQIGPPTHRCRLYRPRARENVCVAD